MTNVAIVTGGASGMGLAVTERLLELGWNVTITDRNEELGLEVAKKLGDHVMFIKSDVAEYDSQANVFVQTWKKWGRLDFVFANAGIGDRINFYAPVEENEDGSPKKPNTSVLDVDLRGPLYSAFLAMHYFRKNQNKGGKIVFTSSMCGIYPAQSAPIYTAAKQGIVGLTRSLAMKFQTLKEPITVNCICPGLVSTGLTKSYVGVSPIEYLTPLSTIVRAVEQFFADGSVTGRVAECTVNDINYKNAPEYTDENVAFIMNGKLEALRQEKVKNFWKK